MPEAIRRFRMQGQENIVVGLDVGTTKICAVVGEVSGNDINIIAAMSVTVISNSMTVSPRMLRCIECSPQRGFVNYLA